MDVYPPRQRSNQGDFSGSSSAGRLGSAFPPFAKSAKDGADTAGRTDVFTRGSRNGAPDRFGQRLARPPSRVRKKSRTASETATRAKQAAEKLACTQNSSPQRLKP